MRLEKEKHPFRPQLYKLPKHVVPRRREGNSAHVTGDDNRVDDNTGKEGGKEGGKGQLDEDDFSLLQDLPGEVEKTSSSAGGGAGGGGGGGGGGGVGSHDQIPGQPKKEIHNNSQTPNLTAKVCLAHISAHIYPRTYPTNTQSLNILLYILPYPFTHPHPPFPSPLHTGKADQRPFIFHHHHQSTQSTRLQAQNRGQ